MEQAEQINTQETVVDEKKIIDQVFKEKETYQQANKNQRAEINEIYEAYSGRIDDNKDTSKSQEVIAKLRTETAYIVPSIFSGNPEIEVEGIGEEDKTIAQVFEKIINFRLQTIQQSYERIEAWVKQSAVFGTSIMKVCWKFETKQNEDGTETPTKDEPYLRLFL
jgi:hypothetical protein